MVKHKHLREAMPLFITLFLLGLFLILDLAYTSYVVYDPQELNITLDKTIYQVDEVLKGNLGVVFGGYVSDETNFSVKILDKKEKNIVEVLQEMNLSYELRKKSFEGINPTSVKALEFNSPGVEKVGIELPKDANIQDIEFKIEGLAKDNSYPDEPELNINEGDEEWHYYGPRTGWKQQDIKPEGLGNQVKDYVTLYGDSENMYCEKIRIPETRDIRINAKYKLYEGAPPEGNIVGRVYSFDGTFLTGSLECDLPEPDNNLEYRGCIIEPQEFSFDDKEYMVCVVSEEGDYDTEYYSLARENEGDSTGYICNDYSCEETGYYDFFITVTEGIYDSKLKTVEDLSFWETSGYATRVAIQTYLFNCISEDPFCVVPIEIFSGSKGIIKLKDLKVKYSSSGGNAEQSNFLDVVEEESAIIKIEGESLVDYVLNIPISLFGVKAPHLGVSYYEGNQSIPEEEDFTVVFGVIPGDLEEEVDIVVRKEGEIPPDPSIDVDEITNNLDSLLFYENEILSILGLTIQINNVVDQLGVSFSLTDDQINNLIGNLPKEIVKEQKITDSYIATPSDVSSVSKEKGIYDFQNEVNVVVEGGVVKIITYSGVQDKYLKIKKRITLKEQVTNVDIYEIIPKGVATDVNEISFKDDSYSVVESDPVVKYNYGILNAGETKEISYMVLFDGMLNEINNLATVVVPQEGDTSLPDETSYVCGDNKCNGPFEDEVSCPEDCAKKLPWFLIVTILILIVLGAWYINFYKGRYSFRKVFKKKEEEPKNTSLVNYVIKARLAGASNLQIRTALAEKGWRKEDIDGAFRFSKK